MHMLESVITFLLQSLSFYLIGYAFQRLEIQQRAQARVLVEKLRCIESTLDMMLSSPVVHGIPVVDTEIVG